MANQSDIPDSEIILRRIPPSGNVQTTQQRPDGSLRATSFGIKPRPGEEGSSWNLFVECSPREILDQLEIQGISSNDWMVCRLRVAEVRAIGLEVVRIPADNNPGHCEIRETKHVKFSGAKWSKLAQLTRILRLEEVATLKAGSDLID